MKTGRANEIMKDIEQKLDKTGLGDDFRTFRKKWNEDRILGLEEDEFLYEMDKNKLSQQQLKGKTERLYNKLRRENDTDKKINLLGEIGVLIMRVLLYDYK